MPLAIWLIMLSGSSWAGPCRVDWTRSDTGTSGRSWFDAEGRPLAVKVKGEGSLTLRWSDAGLLSMEGELGGRSVTVRWEGDHPVEVVQVQGQGEDTEITRDEWTWSGGAVGRWRHCTASSWEEEPRCRELSYDYDPLGHMVRLTEPEGSHLLRWDMDHLVEHTWPSSGQRQRITWDGEGRLESLTDRTDEVEVSERYTRDPHGRVVRREVLAGAQLLDAEVAEYDGPRLLRVGRIQGEQTTWTRSLSWSEEGVPTGLTLGETRVVWRWKGRCEATQRVLSDQLGIHPAPALPAYQAPWLRPDLDLHLPRIPGEPPPLEELSP